MYTELQSLGDLLSFNDIRFNITHEHLQAEPEDLKNIEAHIHSCYELYFNISGDVSFLVNENLFDVSPGTVIFSHPGDVHHCICRKLCMHEHFCLWFEAGDIPLQSDIADFSNAYNLPKDKKDRLNSLLIRLSELVQKPHTLSKTACFFEILDILAAERDQKPVLSADMPETFKDIIKYIDSDFASIKNLNDIISLYYISHATLNRWFRQYFNLSPHEFLQTKKLAYSKHLLEQGCSVTEAGYGSGFSDCAHFVLTFRKKFGQTPLQYKKNLKGRFDLRI